MASLRVWLIGGAGLVGNSLARELVSRGYDVLVSDSLRALTNADAQSRPTATAAFVDLRTQVRVEQVDVRDTDRMQSLGREFRPQVVVWLAALLASESRADPDLARAVQVDAFERFLNDAANAERVVLASSSYVYGHFDAGHAAESHPTRPIDTYGRAKLEAERLLSEAAARLGICSVRIRPSAIYGCGDPRPRFTSSCVEAAAAHTSIVVPDWDFISDFTYVEDAAAGFVLGIADPNPPACMNISFGEARLEIDFARTVASHYGAAVQVGPSTWRESGYVPRRGALDIEVARSIGYRPQFNLEAGIARLLERRDLLLSSSKAA